MEFINSWFSSERSNPKLNPNKILVTLVSRKCDSGFKVLFALPLTKLLDSELVKKKPY